MTKAIRIGKIYLGEGLPKICAPLTGTEREKLLAEAEAVRKAGADMAEWRADLWNGCREENDPAGAELRSLVCELKEMLQDLPLLFTIRTQAEGGRADLSEEAYERMALFAAEAGADLVDVEAFQGDPDRRCHLIRDLQDKGAAVIASTHDFEKTGPKEELLERFRRMDRTGADILKMAVMPQQGTDVTALMEATREMADRYTQRPLISMSMGVLGVRSRIEGASFGSCVTFGTVGEASAPGQLPVGELRKRLAE
ncbi:MAG: type I 3-dehydroquinate dehydratase [Blautia sp.]|nr:type I 3-dehydroquinate dehydratase [Blautia sp.]